MAKGAKREGAGNCRDCRCGCDTPEDVTCPPRARWAPQPLSESELLLRAAHVTGPLHPCSTVFKREKEAEEEGRRGGWEVEIGEEICCAMGFKNAFEAGKIGTTGQGWSG
jgi:hypothetical protein